MDNFKSFIKKLFKAELESSYSFSLSGNNPHTYTDNTLDEYDVSFNIEKNLNYINSKFNTLINSDIVTKKFNVVIRDKEYKAFIVFADGLVDSALINDNVLTPLMLRNRSNTFNGNAKKISYHEQTKKVKVKKIKKLSTKEYINSSLLPQNSVKEFTKFSEGVESINSGNCLLFIDTINVGFNIDVKGFKQRAVETPKNEIVIRGAQQAFNESLRTNTSLIRRLVNNENLIIESISVGHLSKTVCGICYMKNIANESLVAEVKYRLNNIDIDYVLSSGQLEQLIEDNGNYSLPEIIATERPDKVSELILDGRVAIIINGNPYVLVVPAVLLDFLSSPEDFNLKFQFSNLLKFIRIIAVFLTVLLPGLYIAITSFHQELIPTELLFTIVASRESVPFPIIVELFIMEFAFELIREGGLRIPSAIGPTIGIVGALILGQAAVDASIVSPILIIIVSITGLASFAIPDFSLGFHCRLSRFIYILLGYLGGFLGIAMGLVIHLLILTSIESFGVSYLQLFDISKRRSKKRIFVSPIWKRENRPQFLNALRGKKQSHISMSWKNPKQERS